jgi:arylsulfatase A-like enzyme
LEEDLALYDQLPKEYRDRLVTLTSMETGLPVKRPLGEVLRERYAEITAMDRAMGKLRQYLAEEGLRQNTLLWYCGDNGVPNGVHVTTPFRGRKGQVYEGGIRVPGIIEWPARIPKARVTDVNSVTSDMFPTICDLLDLPLPERPLDGISLKPLIDGEMRERPHPICFWDYDTSHVARDALKPYIAVELQEGTTPLVKQMDGRLTRNFRNVHHPVITEQDFAGPRAILDNRYKLVVHDEPRSELITELFDLRDDPAEKINLIEAKPEAAKNLMRELREWQQSVLSSLTGADYR